MPNYAGRSNLLPPMDNAGAFSAHNKSLNGTGFDKQERPKTDDAPKEEPPVEQKQEEQKEETKTEQPPTQQ